MLNARPDDGLACIRPLDMTGHRLKMLLFPINLGDKALLFYEGVIGF